MNTLAIQPNNRQQRLDELAYQLYVEHNGKSLDWTGLDPALQDEMRQRALRRIARHAIAMRLAYWDAMNVFEAFTANERTMEWKGRTCNLVSDHLDDLCVACGNDADAIPDTDIDSLISDAKD